MRRALRAVVALALVLTVVPVVAASPQPTPVCALCGPAFADAADDYAREHDLPEPNVTVTHSRATVRVHENGTATWRVRNELAGGTAWLRSGDRLERVAASYGGRAHGYPEEPTAVAARVVDGGDAVVLAARDSGFAERRAGVLVVDAFHDRGDRPWYRVNADRVVVRGPPGTVVANDPPGVAVDGGAATPRGGVDAPWLYDADATVQGSPCLALGPDDSPGTRLRTDAALALATLPVVVRSLQSYVPWQTAGVGLVLAGAVAGLCARGSPDRRWTPSRPPSPPSPSPSSSRRAPPEA